MSSTYETQLGTHLSTPPTSSPSPTTNLFSLPNELLVEILSYTTYPSLYTLRRTHSRLNLLITRPMLLTHLLHAEKTSPSPLKTLNLYPCFSCVRALPSTYFSDKSRKTPKGYGGIQARKRFCIRCGLRDNRYQPGQAVIVHNIPGVICLTCHKVFIVDKDARLGDDGFCAGHDHPERGADDKNQEALAMLIAGRKAREARRARRRAVGRGRGGGYFDSLDYLDDWDGDYGDGDGDGGSLSESELTEEYLYEAWGYDPEC